MKEFQDLAHELFNAVPEAFKYLLADCVYSHKEVNERLIAAAPELYELVMDELRGEAGGILSFALEAKIRKILDRIDRKEKTV